MVIKAVVFDLDGTLVEFNLDYRRLRAEIIEFLDRKGLPASLFSTEDRASDIMKKAERSMINNGEGELEIEQVRETAFSIMDKYEMEAARTTRTASGVIPTLKALKDMPLKTAVFTLSGTRSVQYILESFRLEQFFDVIVPRESAVEVKPSPEHLRTVLKELNVKPEETIVLGDSEIDMNCAHNLNAVAVGLANERTPIDRLVSAGSDYIISSLTDLLILIRDINEDRSGNFRVS